MIERAIEHDLLRRFWTLLEGRDEDLGAVTFEGANRLPATAFDVNTLASASVAAATLAVAEAQGARAGASTRPVRVDRGHAGAAFRSERYLSAVGWKIADPWDPIAGDYETSDGWIRLHTNYRYHRDAALRVLGAAAAKDAVARAVAAWGGDALEAAVVEAGGCAAFMRSPEQWRKHPQGEAVIRAPLLTVTPRPAPGGHRRFGPHAATEEPLRGVRVLDLTRVIAGPVCTRTLAAFGADVLRIDPPHFEEVGALLGDTTAGKRRAALDLKSDAGRATFEGLVAGADVIVHGYRPDALSRLGFGSERLFSLNPRLVVVCHDAYGWSGPWALRRGFDSLVQMSCGIAWQGRELAAASPPASGQSRPIPLSAQALDHGTGYLLAASACRGLARLIVHGEATETRLSLAGTAACLMGLPSPEPPITTDLPLAEVEPWREDASSDFGPIRRVRYPGVIDGVSSGWARGPGPLGVDEPRWM